MLGPSRGRSHREDALNSWTPGTSPLSTPPGLPPCLLLPHPAALLLPSLGPSSLFLLSFLLGNYHLLGFNYWSRRPTISLTSRDSVIPLARAQAQLQAPASLGNGAPGLHSSSQLRGQEAAEEGSSLWSMCHQQGLGRRRSQKAHSGPGGSLWSSLCSSRAPSWAQTPFSLRPSLQLSCSQVSENTERSTPGPVPPPGRLKGVLLPPGDHPDFLGARGRK